MPGDRRTMLGIVVDAGADIGVLGAISTLSSGTTEQRLINGAIRRTARELCTKGLLVREHSFYTVAGTADYRLPSDFMLPWLGTTWNDDDKWPMRGVSQREWRANKSGFIASSAHQRYRIFPSAATSSADLDTDSFNKRRMHIDPTPTSSEKISFNYRSNHWVQTSATDDIDGVTLSGTDQVVVTFTGHSFSRPDVVWFFGVGGTTELNQRSFTATNTSANTITLLGTNSADFTAWTSGGTARVLQDTNGIGDGSTTYPLFNEELLELGIAWRLRQRLGFSYFDHKDEYDTLLELYVGNEHGNHIIDMSRSSGTRYVGIQEGNFPSS